MRMGHGWLVVHRHGLTYWIPRKDTMSALLVEFIAHGGSHFQPKVIMHGKKCVPKPGTDDMGQLGNRVEEKLGKVSQKLRSELHQRTSNFFQMERKKSFKTNQEQINSYH